MKMNLPCTYFLLFLKIIITNGGNTDKKICDRNISNTGVVEYVCPPSPYASKTSIHVYSRLLTIVCNNTDVLDDTVLPRENHNNIIKLELTKCPLPANGFRDIANRFNITTLKELTFILANAKNHTLTGKELTGLVGIESLELSRSNIFSLNGTIFKNTPNLSVLKLNHNWVKLNEELFENLANLTELSVLSNNITNIPKKTFNNLLKLNKLELWNNKIQNLESGVFDNLKNLRHLNLSLNKIGSIEEGSFRNLINLVNISLGMNQLKEISRKYFENCGNIERIWIERNPNVVLVDNVFAQFGKLKEVNLAHNLLKKISESLFNGSVNLRIIRLNHNELINLEKNVFNGLQNLEELHLDNNKIENLHPNIFSSLRNLKLLHLQHNQIKRIEETLLKNMKYLVKFNLSFNKINYIHSDSLINKRYLEKFSMNHNDLNFTASSQMDKLFRSRYFKKLKEVDLSYNKIAIYPDVLNNMKTMENINLKNNLIQKIELMSMLALKLPGGSNLKINLDFNNITLIEINTHDPSMRRNSNTIVTITNNPIICDCNALNLARFLQEDDSLKNYIWFEPDGVRCSGLLEGKILNEIDLLELTCRLDKKCTKNNVCDCYRRSFDESLIVNCSKRGLTDIPELIPSELSEYQQVIVHLEGNRLKRSPGEYDGYGNVTELYLQENEITNVTWIPASLKVLNLTKNALSLMNDDSLKLLNNSRIVKLHLGFNPWRCDCRSSAFSDFLRGHNKKIDSSYIRCNNNGKEIIKLNKNDLCETNKEFILILSISLLILCLVVTIATTLYFKFKKEILIWLYSRGLCLCLIQEDEIDEDKIYDAFISYSHKDQDFVTENIISTLESGEQPYKLCIHVRDFIPGVYIRTQIVDSIRASRRTLVILSSNFVESVWGKLEFRTAHTEAMLEGMSRVIIIIYGNVDLESLDDDLKSYVKSNTYVEWGDPWFWMKLRYALPKRDRKSVLTSQKYTNMMQSINDKFYLMRRESSTFMVTAPPTISVPSVIEEEPMA